MLAAVNTWAIAAFALLACLALVCALCVRRGEAQALAAAQTASGILVLLIVVLSIWWKQSSLMSVALTTVLLAFPGGLVMARLLEREIEK